MMTASKVALVTGASTGIGRQIACLLAQHGYRVFGTSRQPASETLDNFELLPLDVTLDDSVKACVAAVLERAGRLDVVVNNAGVELLGALEEISIEEAKWIFETNFFGVMRVTSAVLPHLRAQNSGVIINISSLAGVGGSPFHGLYVATKHALEGYTESLLYEVQPFGIRVALVEPGFFRSEISARKQLPAQPIPAYDLARRRLINRWEQLLENGPEPTPVAETVLAIANGTDRRLRHFVGMETFMAEWKYLVPEWLVQQRIRWLFGQDDLFMDTLRALPLVSTGFLMLVALLTWRRGRR